MMYELDIKRMKNFLRDSSTFGEKTNDIISNLIKFLTSKTILFFGCLIIGFVGFMIGLSKRSK